VTNDSVMILFGFHMCHVPEQAQPESRLSCDSVLVLVYLVKLLLSLIFFRFMLPHMTNKDEYDIKKPK